MPPRRFMPHTATSSDADRLWRPLGNQPLPAPGGGVLTRAVRWPAAGQPQLLGRQQGPGQAMVAGAASARTAVGYRTDAKGGQHPVKWRCGS